ncbi:MAG: hypothetical protein AB7D27_07750 [Desulfomicrobium sp.]
MKKSEDVLKSTTPHAQKKQTCRTECMLPFFGLGFDLRPVVARRIRLRVVESGESRRIEPPRHEYALPAGRWLQLRLGREIRGR